jgi:peptidyl-prolyl cis-trans isomerase SurA
MQRLGASLDTATIAAAAYGRPDALDSLAIPVARLSSSDAPEADTSDTMSTEVATIGDSTFTVSDVSAFILSNRRVAQQSVRDAAVAFMTDQALEISARSLQQRDPDFRRKMDEYRDGLLLFEFMQRRVWTPASRDTAGLREMYRSHPERYRYPERVRALRLSAPSDTLLTPYANRDAGDSSVADIAEAARNDSLVVVDTLFVTPSAPDAQQPLLTAEDGHTVGPVESGGQRAVFLRTGTEPPRRMTFEEARSRVIRDYQDAYEQEVLSRLRAEYEVETYPEHLPTLSAADGARSRE